MTDEKRDQLAKINIAPWTALATMAICKPRKTGGNQYRHQEESRIILIDYGFIEGILHKAALVHDLVEDIEGFNHQLIIDCDQDGPVVYKLVLEISRRADENKPDFLCRILNEGSDRACLIKASDRIANLKDCQLLMDKAFITRLCEESEKYVIPIAARVCRDMVTEITHLISNARKILSALELLSKEN